MTRIAIVVVAFLTLCGFTWAGDGSNPPGVADDQAALEQEPPVWHGIYGDPIFGQVPGDGKPGSPHSIEARREFEKQMQEAGRNQQKRRKHLEQFRLLKLLELLDLDESQELRFMKSFTSIRREFRKVGDEKKESLDLLASGLHAEDIADNEIYELLDKIVQAEQEKRMIFERYLEESKSFLSAQQIAKLVIFHERFEYELLEKVRQFRDRPGAPDHPGGSGRPGASGRPGRGPGPGGLSDG